MMIFKSAIPRRTFLRGAGATVGLPLLDAMLPAFARQAEAQALSPVRLSFEYVPNGIIMNRWTPATEGTAFEVTPTLEPLGQFKDRLLVLSGLGHKKAYAAEGDGGGEHARSAAVFLTATHPKRTQGFDTRAGTSIDQIVARSFGKQTQLASLELAVDSTDVVGVCDTGYSCAYSNTLSWRTETNPLRMEDQPRAVFERLFGDAERTDPATRLARIQEQRSILDVLTQRVSSLVTSMGPGDRAKLTEYLDAIRDIERRIEIAEAQASRELPTVDRPYGTPAKFTDHAKLMFDLQVLAFQSDLTRVCTFMIGREQSTRVFDEVGVSDAYHPLTHHQHDPEKIAQVARIDALHTSVFAYFLEKLRSTRDGDATLLDNSIVIYGSAISDGNMHIHDDLPILLAGGGGGRIKGGRHLRYPKDTPMANLYLTVLDKLNVPLERFGDSTGRVDL